MKNKLLLLLLLGFVFSIFMMVYALFFKEPDENNIAIKELPYLGNEKENHLIPSFEFLNQDSVVVNNKTYAGKIWVAEFFFSTCPTICPKMNSQMSRLVKEMKNLDSRLQFLSFSIDPNHDTPSVLKKYAEINNYTFENWDFLTGVQEEQIHDLGVNSFLVHAGKGTEEEGGYAHSGAFTLVDEQGHVRGVYQITNGEGNKDEKEYKRLKKELKILLKHEYGIEQ